MKLPRAHTFQYRFSAPKKTNQMKQQQQNFNTKGKQTESNNSNSVRIFIFPYEKNSLCIPIPACAFLVPKEAGSNSWITAKGKPAVWIDLRVPQLTSKFQIKPAGGRKTGWCEPDTQVQEEIRIPVAGRDRSKSKAPCQSTHQQLLLGIMSLIHAHMELGSTCF